MADPEETEEASWLPRPIMSRPRDQYISSMFSRNLLTRQIPLRKTAYRPRHADRHPLTPPDTPTTVRTTSSSLNEEAESPPPPPSSSSSSLYDMLLDETTLDRPSIRLYRPDAVPEAVVVAAAAAASPTATGGLEAKAWRLVLVSGQALARLKTALAGGAAAAAASSSSRPGSLAFFGAPLAAVMCGARASANSRSLHGGRRHALAVGAALHALRLALADRGLGTCLLHASVARWPLDAVRRALAVPDPPARPAAEDAEEEDDEGGHHLHDHRCAANMQILCALAIGYEDTDLLVGSASPVARGATVGRSMVWVRD